MSEKEEIQGQTNDFQKLNKQNKHKKTIGTFTFLGVVLFAGYYVINNKLMFVIGCDSSASTCGSGLFHLRSSATHASVLGVSWTTGTSIALGSGEITF